MKIPKMTSLDEDLRAIGLLDPLEETAKVDQGKSHGDKIARRNTAAVGPLGGATQTILRRSNQSKEQRFTHTNASRKRAGLWTLGDPDGSKNRRTTERQASRRIKETVDNFHDRWFGEASHKIKE